MTVTRMGDAVLLLVVRASGELGGASRAARDLLRFQSRRTPLPPAGGREKLAVRVDPRMLDDLSEVLDRAATAGRRQFQVRESAGVNGGWSPCCLDAGLKPGRDDIGAIQEALLAARAAGASSARA